MDSLKSLVLASLVETDAVPAPSLLTAKIVTKDTSFILTNVFLSALLEPTLSTENALLAQIDVPPALLINALSAPKEPTSSTVHASLFAPEEHSNL
jgi:hypothetical protein